MGFISKLKEILSRKKILRLQEAQNQQQDTQSPYTYRLSENDNLLISSIRYNNSVKHRNGAVTNVLLADINQYRNGEMIFFDDVETVAFEIPENEPITEVILQKIAQYYMYERNMPDAKRDCFYLGELSQDPYDLGTNNKSEAVSNYVNNTVAPALRQEKIEKIERSKQLAFEKNAEERKRENIFRKDLKEKAEKYIKEQELIKNYRVNNPYLRQVSDQYMGKDGQLYCNYDGINMYNGEILRLRGIDKVGKDENGVYLYKGNIASTMNEYDVEMLRENGRGLGKDVCFTMDRKIEDIIQSNNPAEIRTLLTMLSESQLGENNESLEYLGHLDYYNRIDKNKENLSPALKNTIGRLQTEYSQERINEQYGRY